jgi:hypothetical protein
MRFYSAVSVCCASIVALAGCAGRPSVLPNPDKELRRSSSQFAADAAKRHPYKSDVPQGGEAPARAQVGYMLDRIEVVNLSNEDWNDVEVWVNQQYVVAVPTMQPGQLKVLNFQMIYDEKGNYLPTDKVRVNKLQLLRDGTMYDVRVQLAD